jgi:lysozyme family protein
MTTNDGLAASPPAQERFVRAIDRVLIHEGGDADDPRDAGGRTR